MRDNDDLGGLLGNPRLNDIGGTAFWVEENRYPSFALLESIGFQQIQMFDIGSIFETRIAHCRSTVEHMHAA